LHTGAGHVGALDVGELAGLLLEDDVIGDPRRGAVLHLAGDGARIAPHALLQIDDNPPFGLVPFIPRNKNLGTFYGRTRGQREANFRHRLLLIKTGEFFLACLFTLLAVFLQKRTNVPRNYAPNWSLI